jgi:hypothetical protein
LAGRFIHHIENEISRRTTAHQSLPAADHAATVSTRLKMAHVSLGVASNRPFVSSNPPHDQQNDENDQNHAEDTDTAVTEAIAVTTKAAAEATEEKNNEDDNEDGSERHDRISVGMMPIPGRGPT